MPLGQHDACQTAGFQSADNRQDLLSFSREEPFPRIHLAPDIAVAVTTQGETSQDEAAGVHNLIFPQDHVRFLRVRPGQQRKLLPVGIDEAHILHPRPRRPVSHRSLRFPRDLEINLPCTPRIDLAFIKGLSGSDGAQVLLELGQEPGHYRHHEPVHAGNRGQGQNPDHPDQGGKGVAREAHCSLLPLLFPFPPEERHEGGIVGPFPEDAPEHVGKPEGRHEGVCNRAGPHEPGNENISQESEDPAHQGEPGHRHHRPQHPGLECPNQARCSMTILRTTGFRMTWPPHVADGP